MKQQLSGKVAIVTGAGKGNGEAIAKQLGSAGVNIAVNDINPDRAERVATDIRWRGGAAIAISADISNKFQCVHLVESARAEWGRLDILVNHAHVQPTATVLKMDEWDWDRCLSVNLKGVFFMSQLCGRVMSDENRERGGVIINITSRPEPMAHPTYQAALHASRAGVVAFARECAREFAQYGIRVHYVLAATDSAAVTKGNASAVLEIDGWSGSVGDLSDCAGSVVALCSGVATNPDTVA